MLNLVEGNEQTPCFVLNGKWGMKNDGQHLRRSGPFGTGQVGCVARLILGQG